MDKPTLEELQQELSDLKDKMSEVGSEVYRLQEGAEKEHNCSDPLERAYWQGCKDGLRRALAVIRDDGEWLAIINCSPWSRNSGHVNINDKLAPPAKETEE